jgi:hypothetical protein
MASDELPHAFAAERIVTLGHAIHVMQTVGALEQEGHARLVHYQLRLAMHALAQPADRAAQRAHEQLAVGTIGFGQAFFDAHAGIGNDASPAAQLFEMTFRVERGHDQNSS